MSIENLHGWLTLCLRADCLRYSRSFSKRFKSCPSGCLSRAVFALSEVETRSIRLTQADQRLIETDLSHSWDIHILCDRTNTPAPCQQRKNHFPKQAFSLDRYINRRRSHVTPSICSSLGTRRNPRAAGRSMQAHFSHRLRPESCSTPFLLGHAFPCKLKGSLGFIFREPL